MFRTRIRKILGDVFARKGRTALVSIAIFIGVAGTIGLFSMSDILVGQLREDLKEDELSMLQIFVAGNAGEILDNEATLNALEQVTGVTSVLGATQVEGFFKYNESDESFEQVTINGFTEPYEPRLSIEPMRLIEGSFPQESGGEVAVEQRMAEDFEITIGDTLYFRVLSPSINPDRLGEIGTLEPRTVSGIVFHPYSFQPAVSVYTTFDDANYLAGASGLNLIAARFIDFPTAEENVDTFVNTIASETPYRVIFSGAAQDPEQNQLIVTAQTIANTMGFLALVALVVSGFLVVNVISSIVVEQKRQIGVMKSLGATRFDNFFIYSGIAFVYGVIGVIPGVLVGIWLGDVASKGLAPTLNTVIDGFNTSTPSIITGIVIGLFVPVLAAILPVYFGTRVKILDAMTDLGIDANYGSGPIAKFIALLPIPITVRQGFSNVSIKKSRLAFTVIVLAIAAGAFMGIFAVFSSITGGLGVFFDSFNIDVFVAPNQGRNPDDVIPIIRREFEGDEGVTIAGIEPGFQLQVEFEGYEPLLSAGGPPGIFAYGYDVNSETPPVNYTMMEGEPVNEETASDGVVFSNVLASNMGKSVGDRVVMVVPGNSIELTVVGIAEFPLDQIWMDWRTLALTAGYTATVDITSPVEVPGQAGEFIRYMTSVDVAGAEVVSVGLSSDVIAGFAALIAEGEIFTRGENEIVISQGLAEAQGYSVGDTILIVSTQEGGQTGDYTITGIISPVPQLALLGIPDEFIAASWDLLASADGLELESIPIPQVYFVTTTLADPTADQVQPLVDRLNEAMLSNGVPSTVVNFVEQIDSFSETFTLIQVVLQLVAGLIALIGALGLLTTLFMSVFERQKEIGVMRSIGASSGTVVTQFLTEGLIVGIISWVIGIPLAMLIQVTLLSVTGFDETFPATVPVDGILLGLVGMLVITAIASIWPSLSAARRTVSDILRYQ